MANLPANKCPECNSEAPPGARFCPACGASLVEKPAAVSSPSIPAESQRKPLTILFTDIVGSTSIAEKLDPEEWKEIVSGAHRLVSAAVERYGGTVAQYLGDGVLAFFGAPLTHEDDPLRAVRAALDIQTAMAGYRLELAGLVEDFQMRIGIHTGLVVVGLMGGEGRQEYLALGDAVNLAARLQTAAPPGGVLISEVTAKLVEAAVELEAVGPLQLKGKAEAVQAYKALRLRPQPLSGRGLPGLVSPLVGREAELEQLVQALVALGQGRGQIVLLMGEAGIGKTRLVQEARLAYQECSPQLPILRWLEGRSLSYGVGLAFWPVIQILRADLGLSDADPPARLKVALRRRLNGLFGEKADGVYPYLANLLGVKLEGEAAGQVQSLEAGALKEQLCKAVCEYFQRMAEIEPTVLVFEDLHWADASSLELIGELLSPTDRAPLMVLGLLRPDRQHGSWQLKFRAETDYPHRYTEVGLEALSTQQSQELVEGILHSQDFPEKLREFILERSEGNPFYLEEILRHLIEQGALVQEDSCWHSLGDIDPHCLPQTLQGVLLARVDSLPEGERHTLQVASVIGRSFLFRLLQATEEDSAGLEAHLALLQRQDLVRELRRQPEREYAFKHSLIQDAAYSSLPLERRKEMHRRAALALEQAFPKRQEEFYGILAHHYAAAGERRQAVEYFIKAGDRARLLSAAQEAVEFYQRALVLLKEDGQDEQAARTFMKLGVAYLNALEHHKANLAFDEGCALFASASRQMPDSLPPVPHALRLMDLTLITDLDPGWVEDFRYHLNMSRGLVRTSLDMSIEPGAALRWETSPDGCTYRFFLDPQACWSDGSPLRAMDFEMAFKRLLDPEDPSPNASLLADVEGAIEYMEGQIDASQVGIMAENDHILCLKLRQPAGYFLQLLTMPCFSPVKAPPFPHASPSWKDFEQIPINGPFRVDAHQPGSGMLLVRNPFFTRSFVGNVEQVEISVMPDYRTALDHYIDNLLDVLIIVYGSEISQKAIQQAAGDYKSVPVLSSMYLLVNSRLSPLDDNRVRQALAMSIPKDELTNIFGVSSAWGGFLPPGMPGHSPDISLPFDVQRARSLLAQAGYPGGNGIPDLLYLGFDNPNGRLIGKFMSENLEKYLGISLKWDYASSADQQVAISQGKQFHLVYRGWSADYPDPDNFLRVGLGTMIDWLGDDYKNLVNKARREVNEAQRLKLYAQIDLWLVESGILVPIFYGRRHMLIKPWIHNYVRYHFGADWNKVIIEPHE
jgi:ABC-type oligopeptide transport system substrate-binding subunit/class 3 adenylate cyclase